MIRASLMASSLALVLSAGGLTPAFAIGLNHDGVPDGPYLSSCTNVKVSGSWVSASCTTDGGQSKTSSLPYKDCMRGIENHNGVLWCQRL
jgi:hypothetical protein